MRLWSKYVDDVCLPAVLVQNWSRVMRPVAENWTDAELEAHLKNIPTQERRDIWRRMARQPYTAAELGASMDKLRSEEHTSELQVTNAHLVCRLLLEKKKQKTRLETKHR